MKRSILPTVSFCKKLVNENSATRLIKRGGEMKVKLFVTEGALIRVTCKAWAQNIKQNAQEKMGEVHFELLID